MSEWYDLRIRLLEKSLSPVSIKNQFYKNLLVVLSDVGANSGDRLSAYRDALMAALCEKENASLPLINSKSYQSEDLSLWGLKRNSGTNEVSLSDNQNWRFPVSDGLLNTEDVYGLNMRRNIESYKMDPSLKNALGLDKYNNYNGAGQRDAVRLILSDINGSTFLINLPTGVGKTFIVEGLSAYAIDRELILVIVPTVGLAIDQAYRMEDLMKQRGLDHGGSYCWHSGIEYEERREIISRIYSGKQKVLFCSPESALTSLIEPILKACRLGMLHSIVIDEAHIVDHWGAEFRPHFQGLSALVKSARSASSTLGAKIRCVLLSATYGPKTVAVLKRLFVPENDSLIEVHASFLRPEIEYAVHETSEVDHFNSVLHAIRQLPKPLIVYLTKKEDADYLYKEIKQKQKLGRLAKFTGDTNSQERNSILVKWRNDEIDLVVATSAFGVGINKPNVRSVLHAAIPENIDRFYQEVGRSGRDGKASQSLIVFHKGQFRTAKNLNSQALVTVKVGLERWTQLWRQGKGIGQGKRQLNMGVIPNRLTWKGDENHRWNWRTIMLMQRAGLVEVEVGNRPKGKNQLESSDELKSEDFSSDLGEDREIRLLVTPLEDDLQNESVWSKYIGPQRSAEYKQQAIGFAVLKDWLSDPNNRPLCQELARYYTIDGLGPEVVCSGCPACRTRGKIKSIGALTIGRVSHIRGERLGADWPTKTFPKNTLVMAYFDDSKSKAAARFIDDYLDWIGFLIENQIIQAVRSSAPVIERIKTKLSRGMKKYWIALELDHIDPEQCIWRELVIVPPGYNALPRLGLSENPRILIAPNSIPNKNNPLKSWWEGDASVISLQNLMRRMSSVAN